MDLEQHLAMLKARGENPSLDDIEGSFDPGGLDAAARTVWAEARGEGSPGMQAVANVLVNRKGKPGFPGSVQEVALQPKQFSAWNPGDPNRAKLLAVTEEDPLFAEARRIARDAITGKLADITGGATHYTAPGARESWSPGMEETGTIGRHTFYRKPRQTARGQMAALTEEG